MAEGRSGPSRVLAFDGGGIHSLLTLRLVERIEQERPGFLRQVDIFSGTSAGGINALVLASSDDPASMLGQCISIWEDWPIFEHTVPQALGGLLGFKPFYENTALRQGLLRLWGSRTLGELVKDVVIPSFALDSHHTRPDLRQWRPVSFTTLQTGHRHSHRDMPLVDIALRTSAAPVNFPVYQEHVDGGFGANNPSMFAVVEAAAAHRFEMGGQIHIGDFMEEIVVVNVGAGRTAQYLEVDDPHLGWQFWLADLRRPLLLLEAYVSGNEENVAYMCRELLGDMRYLRINPDVPSTVPYASAPGVAQRLRAIANAFDLGPTLEWLDQHYFVASASAGEAAGGSSAGRAASTSRRATRSASGSRRRAHRQTHEAPGTHPGADEPALV